MDSKIYSCGANSPQDFNFRSGESVFTSDGKEISVITKYNNGTVVFKVSAQDINETIVSMEKKGTSALIDGSKIQLHSVQTVTSPYRISYYDKSCNI
ncbi:MAG: hypothetical protein QW727_00735 [Candidatus Pacearchaeota archaeon]